MPSASDPNSAAGKPQQWARAGWLPSLGSGLESKSPY